MDIKKVAILGAGAVGSYMIWGLSERDDIVRMGRELGIPMPYNEFAYHMIKALEEKNDGLFDYEGRENERTCAR